MDPQHWLLGGRSFESKTGISGFLARRRKVKRYFWLCGSLQAFSKRYTEVGIPGTKESTQHTGPCSFTVPLEFSLFPQYYIYQTGPFHIFHRFPYFHNSLYTGTYSDCFSFYYFHSSISDVVPLEVPHIL